MLNTSLVHSLPSFRMEEVDICLNLMSEAYRYRLKPGQNGHLITIQGGGYMNVMFYYNAY